MEASAPAAGPANLLRAALAADPARPALTFYDDATGERVELSWATLDNWVAKTANLLVDGLGVDAGARVALRLPAHWLTPVWLLGCWSAGAIAAPGANPEAADVVVTGPDGLADDSTAGPADLVAVSLRPLNAPFTTPLPAGVLDYGREVSAYGDHFTPVAPPRPDDPALELAGRRWTQGELAAVDPLGLVADDRVLTTLPYDDWRGLHAGLLAPLRARAGVVLVAHPRADALPARITQERITARFQ